MAPKFKFTRAEITDAALQVVRRNGIGALTARAIADELGVSTQPVFTCFSTMAEARGAVRSAAESIYDGYVEEGLRAEIPFYGFGMQYIRFAREEPELYRLLFLTHDAGEKGAMDAMRHSLDYVKEPLERIYHISEAEAERPVDRGVRHRRAHRHRRLPILRRGDRRYSDRLQPQYLQGDKGNSRLCLRRF